MRAIFSVGFPKVCEGFASKKGNLPLELRKNRDFSEGFETDFPARNREREMEVLKERGFVDFEAVRLMGNGWGGGGGELRIEN